MYGALGSLQEEHGMKGESLTRARLKLREVAVELMLPGTLRWLQKIKARAVLHCPMINLEAAVAAKVAGIPLRGSVDSGRTWWISISLEQPAAVFEHYSTEEVFQERCQFQGQDGIDLT